MRDAVLNWELKNGTMVAVQGPGVPSDATWERFLRDLRKTRLDSMLTIASGNASLRATQRTDIIDCAKTARVLSVVLDSPISRAMATALSWFMGNLQVFSPRETSKAIAALRLSAEELRWVEDAAARLRSSGAASASQQRPL